MASWTTGARGSTRRRAPSAIRLGTAAARDIEARGIATTDPQPRHATENPINPATFTRRLCPYPETAQYEGFGDPNSVSSFVCVAGEREHRPPCLGLDNEGAC